MKDGQTFGQWLRWDFEANGYLEIQDKNGNQLYIEFPTAHWVRREFDSQGNEIYYENSDGYIDDNRTPEVITHTNGRKYQLIP
jgi:hypothetical protein